MNPNTHPSVQLRSGTRFIAYAGDPVADQYWLRLMSWTLTGCEGPPPPMRDMASADFQLLLQQET